MTNEVTTPEEKPAINFNDMVKVLCKPGEAIIEDLTPTSIHVLHMAVGIAGEVAEFQAAYLEGDMINIKEELGDLEFFMQGLIQLDELFDLDEIDLLEAIEPYNNLRTPLVNMISIIAGDLLDSAKRLSIYGKPNDDTVWANLKSQLVAFHHYIRAIGANLFHLSPEELQEANIEKLGERYESFKYTNDKAMARSDKHQPATPKPSVQKTVVPGATQAPTADAAKGTSESNSNSESSDDSKEADKG